MLKLLCIFREKKFSPSKINADREILQSTGSLLQPYLKVTFISGESISVESLENYDFILSMAEGKEALFSLRKIEDKGVPVVNSPGSIEKVFHRKNMIEIGSKNNLPIPESEIIRIDTCKINSIARNLWVKRGDAHALTDRDVIFISTKDRLDNVIHDFKNRGIDTLILQEHIEGETLKFYRVRPDFLKLFWNNGTLYQRKDVFQALLSLCNRLDNIYGLEIYGGDIIVDKDNKIWIIDINDWPSFRMCVREGSMAIKDLVLKRLNI